MKTAAVVAGLALLATQANAHYIFEYLTVGGVKGGLYQNIRANTNMNSPVTDLASNDLRCNVGATGTGTSTIAVAAGSSVSFTADIAVYHQGPVSFYMHKSPTTASADDGSGVSWFKIKDIGPTFTGGTATWDLETTYSVTIPAAVPSGDYLLRIQQLAIHNPYPAALPQFYISCAQITVTGGGSGVPSPLVAIPGAFKDTDPGYTVNIYNNFTNYTVPGPAVWTGGSGGSSPTTMVTSTTSKAATTTAATTSKAATTSTSSTVSTPTGSTGTAQLYGQCGGSGWTGPTVCATGTCKVSNQYYSQCLP